MQIMRATFSIRLFLQIQMQLKILMLFRLRMRRRRLITKEKKKKNMWMRKLFTERETEGEYQILVKELRLFDHYYF